MTDYLYSPLFNMGLSLCSTPMSSSSASRKSTSGHSFLTLDIRRAVCSSDNRLDRDTYIHSYASETPYVQMSLCITSSSDLFITSVTPPSSKFSSDSSPSKRSLPLPKPAPLSGLPAIPISTESPASSNYAASVAASSILVPSTSSTQSKAVKYVSIAPTFFNAAVRPEVKNIETSSLRTISSTVSTNYRRKRRSDALAALEGRRRDGPSALGASFVPSILQEDEDEAEEPETAPVAPPPAQAPLRSHLSLTSTVYPASRSRSRSRSRPHSEPDYTTEPMPELPADFFMQTVSRPALANSPMSPSFPMSPHASLSESSAQYLINHRRASTGTTIGWGINFIDLDDDAASVWTGYMQSMLS